MAEMTEIAEMAENQVKFHSRKPNVIRSWSTQKSSSKNTIFS
jgi:hypothetical protein